MPAKSPITFEKDLYGCVSVKYRELPTHTTNLLTHFYPPLEEVKLQIVHATNKYTHYGLQTRTKGEMRWSNIIWVLSQKEAPP